MCWRAARGACSCQHQCLPAFRCLPPPSTLGCPARPALLKALCPSTLPHPHRRSTAPWWPRACRWSSSGRGSRCTARATQATASTLYGRAQVRRRRGRGSGGRRRGLESGRVDSAGQPQPWPLAASPAHTTPPRLKTPAPCPHPAAPCAVVLARDGREVGRRAEGDFFGEQSLIAAAPRADSAYGAGPARGAPLCPHG